MRGKTNKPVLFIHGGGEGIYEADKKLATSLQDDLGDDNHLARYAKKLPQAIIRQFDDRGHQFKDNLSEVADDIKRL